MSQQYSHPDAYSQYSQYPQYAQYSQPQSVCSYQPADQATFDNVNNNYYDSPEAAAPSDYVPVVDSSPVLPAAYATSYTDPASYAPMNSGSLSYPTSVPMPGDAISGGHMPAYAPNPAMEMPQENVPQYGNGYRAGISHSESCARPPAHPQYLEPAVNYSGADERHASVSQSPNVEAQWTSDYNEVDTTYYETTHDNAAPANPSDHHAAPISHPHPRSNEFYDYQQPHGYHSLPQHAENAEYRQSFGLYSPRRHYEHQQLAQDAPYEPYNEQLDEEYGVLPAHQPEPEQYQTPVPMSYDGYPNAYATQQPCEQLGMPSSQPSSPQRLLSYSPESSTSAQLPSQVGPIRCDLFSQQRQAMGYQKHLEYRYNAKRQLSAQFEQFETNHRRLDGCSADHPSAYASAHHHPVHHHQPQASTSSLSNHPQTSHRAPMPTPPIVPSQAHERSSPVIAQDTANTEEKKDPPKKPALACLFCRKRKIACGPPPPDSVDRTCNQCQRRKQYCEYPTESRRGIRKTPKETAPEEPTVHKFVQSDAGHHDGSTGARGRGRRKRAPE